jgi:hypothetical protein
MENMIERPDLLAFIAKNFYMHSRKSEWWGTHSELLSIDIKNLNTPTNDTFTFGEIGLINFPFISFGSVNTTNLFNLDELIIFSWYLKNRKKYTAFIIEPRKHKALEFVLKNFLENLSNEWSFIIFHGNLNKEYVQNIVDTKLSKYKNRITLKSIHKDNIGTSEYSKLLTTRSFYNQIPTEIFLVFQTDTMIIQKNKDNILDFLDYDFVGAPYVGKSSLLPGCVGNGGLSLRKKSKMLEILDNVPYLRIPFIKSSP